MKNCERNLVGGSDPQKHRRAGMRPVPIAARHRAVRQGVNVCEVCFLYDFCISLEDTERPVRRNVPCPAPAPPGVFETGTFTLATHTGGASSKKFEDTVPTKLTFSHLPRARPYDSRRPVRALYFVAYLISHLRSRELSYTASLYTTRSRSIEICYSYQWHRPRRMDAN
jgi:hypothetical protein